MPKFSQRSLRQLRTCHESLQMIFEEVIKHYDCTVLEGYRTEERQRALVDAAFSRTMKSAHRTKPATGVDVAPYPVSWKQEDLRRFYHFSGFVLATAKQMQRDGRLDGSFELRSGLDWDGDRDFADQTLLDGPHFQMHIYAEQGGLQ